jgi:hypothetical protein
MVQALLLHFPAKLGRMPISANTLTFFGLIGEDGMRKNFMRWILQYIQYVYCMGSPEGEACILND